MTNRTDAADMWRDTEGQPMLGQSITPEILESFTDREALEALKGISESLLDAIRTLDHRKTRRLALAVDWIISAHLSRTAH